MLNNFFIYLKQKGIVELKSSSEQSLKFYLLLLCIQKFSPNSSLLEMETNSKMQLLQIIQVNVIDSISAYSELSFWQKRYREDLEMAFLVKGFIDNFR